MLGCDGEAPPRLGGGGGDESERERRTATQVSARLDPRLRGRARRRSGAMEVQRLSTARV